MLRNLFTSRGTPPETLTSSSSGWPTSRSNSSMSISPHDLVSSGNHSPSSSPLPPLMPDHEASPGVSVDVLTPEFEPLRSPSEVLVEDVYEAEPWDGESQAPRTRGFRLASHSPLRKSLGFQKEDYFLSNPGSSSTKTCTLNGIPPHLSRVRSVSS